MPSTDFRLPDSILTADSTSGALPRYKILGDGSNNPESRNDFRLYPNPTARPDTMLDDGYAKIPLGFTYRYNDTDFDSMYVSINGFITFDVPPGTAEITRDPKCLFIYDVGGSVPNNVIAPY
jgi:hypothetical protein